MIIPVSKVDQELDVKEPREGFYTAEDRENYEQCTPPGRVMAAS